MVKLASVIQALSYDNFVYTEIDAMNSYAKLKSSFNVQAFYGLSTVERDIALLKGLLKNSNGSLDRAAQTLGVSENVLMSKLQEHQLLDCLPAMQ